MEPSAFDLVTLEYLRDCARRGLRPATIRYYRMVLTRFATVTGISEPRELTIELARSFQDQQPQLAIGSVKGFFRALRTFSSWAADEGLLVDDPLRRLRLPRADSRVVVVPTDAELRSLLLASAPPLRVSLALILATGVRISELCGLDVDDVRPDELLISQPKNRVGRVVPVDPTTAAVLLLYASDLRMAGDRAFFVARHTRRLSPSAVRLALTDARHRAGIELRLSPHVLRHWHARDLASHATNERLLAARMGWRTQPLVERYAPVTIAELARDVARYAPLARLRDVGVLDGCFPPSVLRATFDQRSKKTSARSWTSAISRPGVARQSCRPSAGRAAV